MPVIAIARGNGIPSARVAGKQVNVLKPRSP
jgi:hypothetical protein